METNFFKQLNFTQFVNRNVEISGKRLHLPTLKDVAWLEDAQLIFQNFQRGSREKIIDKCMGN